MAVVQSAKTSEWRLAVLTLTAADVLICFKEQKQCFKIITVSLDYFSLVAFKKLQFSYPKMNWQAMHALNILFIDIVYAIGSCV